MSGALSPTHWLIIIGVLVVLFGARKLPDAARGLGQSLRIFKAEVGAGGDDRPAKDSDAPAASTSTPAAGPPTGAMNTTSQASGGSGDALDAARHDPDVTGQRRPTEPAAANLDPSDPASVDGTRTPRTGTDSCST